MPNQTLNSIPQLETVTAKDLLTQPIEPLEFTIDAILPYGLFILAGSPKVGKSWLALDMSNCVPNGDTFWSYPTAQGEVLYLALEDNKKRSQERLNKLSPICNIDAPTDIHFAYKTKKLGGGFAEQITEFLDGYPQTKLIVVDTLQYIRNTGKFTGTYSGDYHDMDALREIITGRGLTMLLVTHNHKSDGADPVNRVIGSAGLTGAVDGIFILEKNKRTGSTQDSPSPTVIPKVTNLNCDSMMKLAVGSL
jgi:RecA-family ATPase